MELIPIDRERTYESATDWTSAIPGQWEHVTFARAGIVEIPRVPDSGTALGLSAIAMLGLAGARRFVCRLA